MTQINYLRVSGFKAIEELEVEPKNINIITGRNNTGKTSFLQSLDIIFNPKNVKDYEDDVDKLINIYEDSASLRCEYTRRQTALSEFDSEDPGLRQREIGIRKPRESEILSFGSQVISDIIKINEEYPLARGHFHQNVQTFEQNLDISTEEDLNEILLNLLRESLSDIPEQTFLSSFGDNCIVFEISGDEYPYIYLGDGYDEIKQELIDNARSRLYNSLNIQEMTEDETDFVTKDLERTFANLLAPRFGKGRFIGDAPPSESGLKLVDSGTSKDVIDLSVDDAAIRTSDIEGYLKENEIVENLDDFSFDDLVFEEEQGKYDIPYSFMGDGFKSIVRVLWVLFDSGRHGDILLLEEPENHMHPGYVGNLVKELIRISREEDIQLFITTHNIDFINAFFSNPIKRAEGDFLSDHYRLIQLTEPISRALGYEDAEKKAEELHVDLRGV